MSDGRRYDSGDIIKVASGREFEVTGVSYQETNGKKHSFTYSIRDKEEIEAERVEAKKQEAALKKSQAEAEARDAELAKASE